MFTRKHFFGSFACGCQGGEGKSFDPLEFVSVVIQGGGGSTLNLRTPHLS